MAYASWLPLLLGFLSAIGPISTDMYLPAFPAIEQSLALRPGSVQLTLATWFLGLAIGQISQGSLADRFGRRGPLVAGMVLYTLANIGCALAPDLVTLSAMRFVAAIGGSASMVIPRAIVRDLAEGYAAARLMSRLTLIMGAAPILAPSLGGLALVFAGWQAIFWFCAAYGALSCTLVWRFLPDTLAQERRMQLGLVSMLGRYVHVARDRVFFTHAMMAGMGMFGMFAFLGGSPGVLIDTYGITPQHYAVIFGFCAGSYIVSSQVNPMLLRRFGAMVVSRWAVRVFLLATFVLNLAAFSGMMVWWWMIPPIMASMACQGINLPNATVGALTRHAAQAGTASALMGTLQFCLAATSGLLVGVFSDGTARPMAVLMLLGAIGTVIAELCRPRPTVA